MRIYPKFETALECMVCGTNENKPCTLIPIDGTIEGNIEEAKIIHIDCLNIRYNPEHKMFYQKNK